MRDFAALLLISAKNVASVSVKPAEMLLMPLVVGLVLVGVGYMLASLYPADGVDLAGFFASAAVGAALAASKHVSRGHSDPSDDVLCEFHQLCDAELIHDVVHVVELVVGDVAGCCWTIFPISASTAHVTTTPSDTVETRTLLLETQCCNGHVCRRRSAVFTRPRAFLWMRSGSCSCHWYSPMMSDVASLTDD